jgi:hypothetical protein
METKTLKTFLTQKIAETKAWRIGHLNSSRTLEALACSIRIKAFTEALQHLESLDGGHDDQ